MRKEVSSHLPQFQDNFYPIFFYSNEHPAQIARLADYYSKYEGLAEQAEFEIEKLYNGKSEFDDYEELSNYLKHQEKSIVPKKGKTEYVLFKALREVHGDLIKTSYQIGKYYPDIIVQDIAKHLYLIIEIDERTTQVLDMDEDDGDWFYKTKKIHISENIPSKRTLELNSFGWSLLRFSDEQVSNDTIDCVNVVSSVIAYLTGERENRKGDNKMPISVAVYT